MKTFFWKIGRHVTCDSKNVIYLLQCDKDLCRQKYIGMTKDSRDRVYQHVGYGRNKVLTRSTREHFNLPEHGNEHMILLS